MQKRPSLCSGIREELQKCTDEEKRMFLQLNRDSGLAGSRPLSRFHGSALPRASWSALLDSPLEGAFDTTFYEPPRSHQ